MESWDSDLSNDMYFVKIIKSCDSIDPFTVYVTEVRSAHVGVRTFIPSHCVNQRISRQDKT